MSGAMEKLAKIAWYFRWIKGNERRLDDRAQISVQDRQKLSQDSETSRNFFTVLESILLWENSVNSITVVVVFNILFWSIVVLEVRGFAAASSAALVVVFGYGTLEAQVKKEYKASNCTTSPTKTEKICNIIHRVKSSFEGLKLLRKNKPGTFCTGVCILSIVLWLIGRVVNGMIFTYAICMSILLAPAFLLKVPNKVFPTKEWDNEIDEFLPLVTDDNLEVLKRAGETGDHSSTPPSGSLNNQMEPFNDNELFGLKMPSHEDGSTDGLELSEFELNCGEADVNGLKIQSCHFEGNSSSEEDSELPLKSKNSSSNSDDSESEFEIINRHEISYLKSV